jgi:signal transduction histidine kinase
MGWGRLALVGAIPETLHRELGLERIQSARRVNTIRLWGVSAFFVLFLVLGGWLRLPAWIGNLDLFAFYWSAALGVFAATLRFEAVARFATLAVALLDMPMVYLVQRATLDTSPSASGVAGFTIGVYVLLVILAALSLETWFILFSAGAASAFEVLLQYEAGVGEGGMISTPIVLGLTAGACTYARHRLVDLAGRVEREIAEQRRAERALRQSERMASLGTLAAGVAHEINTPLTYVVTNLSLITERLSAAGAPRAAAPALGSQLGQLSTRVAEVREHVDALVPKFVKPHSGQFGHDLVNALTPIIYKLTLLAEDLARLPGVAPGTLLDRASADAFEPLIQQALEGAERVRSIVRDLKTFSHPDEESLGVVDLRGVLKTSINLASGQIRHRARLQTDLGPAPAVRANERRLSQVFVNLLVNAAQAIPDGIAERNEIRIAMRTDEAGRAVVEVRDTGAGIAPEHLPRLFDPFFTTKPAGEGTGLGLSICHSIVSALGGELSVESELGQGSTFRVTLPAAEAPNARTDMPGQTGLGAGSAAAPPPTRRARILAIDDDPHIGNAVRETLAREHDVVTLTSASEALRRLESGEHYDLILCDLMMPMMTGIDLHEILRRARPELAARMVFLTGGAFTARARTFLTEVANPRLEKPFDPKSLRSFVRQLL